MLRHPGVKVRGDAEVQKRDAKAVAATEKDRRTEYLEPIISVAEPPIASATKPEPMRETMPNAIIRDSISAPWATP